MGVEQADYLFESNMAKLVRDYKGMLIYYGLSSQGLVEKPVIRTTQTGTHIMAKEVIYDRTLYQVTKDGRFQAPKPLPKAQPPRSAKARVKPKVRKKSAPRKKPAAAQTAPSAKKQQLASASPPPAPKANVPVKDSIFSRDGLCEFARLKGFKEGKGWTPCKK